MKEVHFHPGQATAEITIAGILGASPEDVETDVETDTEGTDFIVWNCGQWFGWFDFDNMVMLIFDGGRGE